MNRATGWHVAYDETAPSSPWVASNVDLAVTVFGESIDQLGAEIVHEQRLHLDEHPLTIARHVELARREMGEEVWQRLNREWPA